MGRPNRIHISGAWYWVSNRVMPGKLMFKSDDDYLSFLTLMEDFFERYGVEIHGYCLINTEYHFLLKTTGTNLPEAMRHIQSIYTQHWNKRWSSAGPLFRGRYHATLFQHKRYLLDMSAVLHSIPSYKAITQDDVNYPWSSCRIYENQQQTLPNNLVCSAIVSELNERQIVDYRQFMKSSSWHYLRYILDSKKRPSVIGDSEFKLGISLKAGDSLAFTSHLNDDAIPKQLDKVLDSVSTVMSVKRKALFEAKRGQLNIPRMMAIYLSHSKARLSLNELASEFGLNHYSSASSAMQRYQKLRAREVRIKRLESEVIRRLEH